MLNAFIANIFKDDKNIQALNSVTKLITSGEALSVETVKNWYTKTNIPIHNLYGPTEASIDVTHYTTSQEDTIIPIGCPIWNTQLYIIDKHHHLLPMGAVGEICISGDGLARGYLNKAALTKEKFVDNTFKPGSKMYKTGDIGRWLPDGNIEYIGRKDEQVKIRGYRIELGEIETALQKHVNITAAAVIAKENQQQEKELVAYIVSKQTLNTTEIRNYLSNSLPLYMLPSHYVQLDALPLNANGKLDKKALPNPETLGLSSGVAYIAPTNEVEKHLVAVYEEVLKKHPIGINEDFFALGGDSIKSIQAVSRLKQRGYTITIKDILTYPTIQNLAPKAIIENRTIEQGIIKELIPLSPIQHYFFEQHRTNNHQYNQSILLESKKSIDEKALRAALDKIILHHDALRIIYHQTAVGWVQENKGEEQSYSFELIENTNQNLAAAPAVASVLTSHHSHHQQDASTFIQHCSRIQSSINLQTGPLFKVALFKNTQQPDLLLLVCHHLVIDGVSWRILLEDLSTLYQQYLLNQPLILPLKTDSFYYWQQKQIEYATSKTIQQQEAYWSIVASTNINQLPKDNAQGSNRVEDTAVVDFTLNEKRTAQLLTQCYKAYQTDINDLLLAALTLALREIFDLQNIAINLEGHGREDIGSNIDVSRTVGWFTSLYPVIINATHSNDIIRHIIEVKETLHRIPNKGIGYGTLRYLAKKPYRLQPEIVFNYLGDFGEGVYYKTGEQLFEFSEKEHGQNMPDKMQRDYVLDISGMIVDKKMRLSIRYSRQQYTQITIERLSEAYQQQLENIIQQLSTENATHITPVDLTYKELTLEQLQELNNIV